MSERNPATSPADRPNGEENPTESPQHTPRRVVLFRREAKTEGLQKLKDQAGLRLASSSDFGHHAVRFKELGDAEALVFEHLGVAIVAADPNKIGALEAPKRSESILAIQSETVYRLLEREDEPAEIASAPRSPMWNLEKTCVLASPYSGQGVRVAILDTGLSKEHADFDRSQRIIQEKSFAPKEWAYDGDGHGTHVIGIACGPKTAAAGPRYGIAHQAEIYSGRIFDSQNEAEERHLLAGLEWAVANKCRVVLLALWSPVKPGQPYPLAFEHSARRAADQGTLIVAAAGKGSTQQPQPVSYPASAPSVMAVTAVGVDLRSQEAILPINPDGGWVDLAAPGYGIYSSHLEPKYRTLQGTSQAAAHVAGIAALYVEQEPSLSSSELWYRLLDSARPIPDRDGIPLLGAGLVKAPTE